MTEQQSLADDFPAESWVLLRVLPGDVPAAVRVRHLLKRMLRDYGIKVIRVTGFPPETAVAAFEIPEVRANR